MPVPFQARTERDLKRPGYCATAHERTIINLVASGQLHKGDKIIAKRLEDEFKIPRSERYLVMGALRHQGFIDEQSCITETLEQVAHATGEEYQARFKAVFEESYADAYKYGLDPACATQQEFKEAFQACNYEPHVMQPKMISLFKGLCRMAGILPDENAPSESVAHQTSDEQNTDAHSFAPPLNDVLPAYEEFKPVLESQPLSKTNGVTHAHSGDSPVEELLAAFEQLYDLRKSASWTEAYRAMWMQYLKINHNLLGIALELMERTEK